MVFSRCEYAWFFTFTTVTLICIYWLQYQLRNYSTDILLEVTIAWKFWKKRSNAKNRFTRKSYSRKITPKTFKWKECLKRYSQVLPVIYIKKNTMHLQSDTFIFSIAAWQFTSITGDTLIDLNIEHVSKHGDSLIPAHAKKSMKNTRSYSFST